MTLKARCGFCKKVFPVKARGRRPAYCSASHRQRAYARRRDDSHSVAKKHLKYDIASIQGEDLARRFIHGVVRDLITAGVVMKGPKFKTLESVPRTVPGPQIGRQTTNEMLSKTLRKTKDGPSDSSG